MEVTLQCFGMLKDHLPPAADRGRLAIALDDGSRVRDAIAAAGLPSESIFAILIDGAPGNLEQPLGEGAEVTLMPQFTGGRFWPPAR